MQNNHDRPDFYSYNLEKGTGESLSLNQVNVIFKDGVVTSISVDNPKWLTYFRLQHHIERYEFATNFILQNCVLKPIKILDIGIGDGYGIAKSIERINGIDGQNIQVTGVEIDKDTAKNCRQRYPDFNIIESNILNCNELDKFDVIFCYELLGNESLDSDLTLLNRVKELLTENGLLFVSIATFDESEFGRGKRKYYSKRIYSTKTFQRTINGVFTSCQNSFYGQHYPLKRVAYERPIIWPNPEGNLLSDFSIAVIMNEKS